MATYFASRGTSSAARSGHLVADWQPAVFLVSTFVRYAYLENPYKDHVFGKILCNLVEIELVSFGCVDISKD